MGRSCAPRPTVACWPASHQLLAARAQVTWKEAKGGRADNITERERESTKTGAQRTHTHTSTNTSTNTNTNTRTAPHGHAPYVCLPRMCLRRQQRAPGRRGLVRRRSLGPPRRTGGCGRVLFQAEGVEEGGEGRQAHGYNASVRTQMRCEEVKRQTRTDRQAGRQAGRQTHANTHTRNQTNKMCK